MDKYPRSINVYNIARTSFFSGQLSVTDRWSLITGHYFWPDQFNFTSHLFYPKIAATDPAAAALPQFPLSFHRYGEPPFCHGHFLSLHL